MYPPKYLFFLFLLILIFFTSSYFGTNHQINSIVINPNKVSTSIKLSSQKYTSSGTQKIVYVDDFEAQANGKDDTEAFKKAWEVACSSEQRAIIIVPKQKVYYLKPVLFPGPCKSDIIFQIFGTIKASTNRSDYLQDLEHWIVFHKVDKLRVKGGGTINGNGKIWWENSCKFNKSMPCSHAPIAVSFSKCKSLIVANLLFKNSQQMHMKFRKCTNVTVANLMMIAPGNSPNTDGIHISRTQNIRIRKSVIRTGDDCISIVSGSKNVEVTDIVCGPGHGISIGSLGAGHRNAKVSNVFINRATLLGTTNGVRIKTWQGGLGHAKNIVFQNVTMKNVKNPIIINQNYCDKNRTCTEQKSAVQVSNIVYRDIRGTSASEIAMKFDCSKSFPCEGILLQDINLGNENGKMVKASCLNVKFASKAKVSPQCS